MRSVCHEAEVLAASILVDSIGGTATACARPVVEREAIAGPEMDVKLYGAPVPRESFP
jgi:hypothetical protein